MSKLRMLLAVGGAALAIFGTGGVGLAGLLTTKALCSAGIMAALGFVGGDAITDLTAKGAKNNIELLAELLNKNKGEVDRDVMKSLLEGMTDLRKEINFKLKKIEENNTEANKLSEKARNENDPNEKVKLIAKAKKLKEQNVELLKEVEEIREKSKDLRKSLDDYQKLSVEQREAWKKDFSWTDPKALSIVGVLIFIFFCFLTLIKKKINSFIESATT